MADKIEELKTKMQKVVDAFNELKRSGINQEILIAYIQYKTKLPISSIRKMLESYEEFHTSLIKQEILNKFGKI